MKVEPVKFLASKPLITALGNEPAAIRLVFPPLVQSGFGSYYPSTAVLAGYLSQCGIESLQADYNNAFNAWITGKRGEQAIRLLDDSPKATAAKRAVDVIRLAAGSADTAAWMRDLRKRRPATWRALIGALCAPVEADLNIGECQDLLRSRAPIVRFFEGFYQDVIPVAGTLAAPKLVGLSLAMGPQILPGLVLAQDLARRWPDARIVVGGPVVSLLAGEDLRCLLSELKFVSCAVQYDGEEPLRQLCAQSLRNEWRPKEVPNCVSSSDEAPAVEAVSGLRLSDVGPPLYQPSLLQAAEVDVLSVTQARGCYWGKCSYCDFVELYKGSPHYRGRRAEEVVDEIQALVDKHGVSRYTLITEAIPPAFARAFSQELVGRGLNIRWSSFAMVHRQFDESLFRLMRQSGCDYLVVGLETMTSRVLKLVEKWADCEANAEFLGAARAAGIKLRINLIPDLPTTTFAEASASLNELSALVDCMELVAVFPFEATRSSRVGREPARYGLVQSSAQDGKRQAQFEQNHFSVADTAMSQQDRTEIIRRYRVFERQVNSKLRTTPEDESSFVVLPGAIDGRVSSDNGALRLFLRILESDQPFTLESVRKVLPAPDEAPLLMRRLADAALISAV